MSNLDKMPGERMQYYDIMTPDTAYVSMLFGTMHEIPMQLLFDVL